MAWTPFNQSWNPLQLPQTSSVKSSWACAKLLNPTWARRTRTSTASTSQSFTASPSAAERWQSSSSLAWAFSGWSAGRSSRALPCAPRATKVPRLLPNPSGLPHSRSRWWNPHPALSSPSPTLADGWKVKRRSSKTSFSSPSPKPMVSPRLQSPTPTCYASRRFKIFIRFLFIFLVSIR